MAPVKGQEQICHVQPQLPARPGVVAPLSDISILKIRVESREMFAAGMFALRGWLWSSGSPMLGVGDGLRPSCSTPINQNTPKCQIINNLQ